MHPLCKSQDKKIKISKKVQEEIDTVESRFGMDVTETDKIVNMDSNKYTYFKIDYRSNKVFISFLKRNQKCQKNVAFFNKLKKKRIIKNILVQMVVQKTRNSESW